MKLGYGQAPNLPRFFILASLTATAKIGAYLYTHLNQPSGYLTLLRFKYTNYSAQET